MYASPAAIAGCMIYHGAFTLLVILILLLVKALKTNIYFSFLFTFSLCRGPSGGKCCLFGERVTTVLFCIVIDYPFINVPKFVNYA